ncbi:unnamed protein product [Pleuronectes platessa]|uniref:Secreted protein n=1 Tax=Pleuronectes platessa TaxID=8262 RepID=A0A9N7V3G9_PLEPL|nr:unnamed protein product [Pleuronectes platessa]
MFAIYTKLCHSLLISCLLVFFHSPVSAPLCKSATPPHQGNSPHLCQPWLHLSLLLSLLQCQIVLVTCLTFQRSFPGLITCCRPACLVSALDITSAFCLRPRVSPVPSGLRSCSALWLHSSTLDLSAS